MNDKLNDALAALAERLNMNVENLGAHAARHVVLDSIAGIMVGVTTIFGTFLLAKHAKKSDDEFNILLLGIFAAIFALIGAAFICANIPSLIEPEGYLIRDLLSR